MSLSVIASTIVSLISALPLCHLLFARGLCSYSPDDDIEEAETVDPRVETTLESLNAATDEINRIETRLSEARNTRDSVRKSVSAKLANFKTKFSSSSIKNTAVYFEAFTANLEAQVSMVANDVAEELIELSEF